MKNPAWLKNAIVYEIYPQSFYDSNGDGIGDLPGIIQKLDYIRSLNVNAIWLNPCFLSPFQDAGYDVEDYRKVAPRYGTNDDLVRLFNEAHAKGIKVILDLVAGHTSVKHPWFVDSERGKQSPYANYYIWTNDWFEPTGDYRFINGMSKRDGYFMINFFYSQPALNYGFCPPDPALPWQLPMDHPDVLKVREELRGIMKFWLDLGCDGFRVDMAASLIRGKDAARGIQELWHDYRGWLDKNYPEAILISEWSQPTEAIGAGFHIDFMVHCGESGYTKLFRAEPERIGNSPHNGGNSFFDLKGLGDAVPFLEQYQRHYDNVNGKGYIGLVSGNHDIGRLRGGRSLEEVKVAMTFLMLLPGVPFLYAGDEIGMNNVYGLGNVEGSYNRSAARTPVQWDGSAKAGFSTADPAKFYLALDPAADRPNIADQDKDADSLLNHVRALFSMRQTEPALQNDASYELLYAKKNQAPVIYQRAAGKQRIVVAVNPTGKAVKTVFALPDSDKFRLFKGQGSLTTMNGASVLELAPASFAVFKAEF